MARAPLQVLVIPFRWCDDGSVEFAVFHRRDRSMWQFIAGGAEDDEIPLEAAVREAAEEASIPYGVPWTPLDSLSTVPRIAFPGGIHWPAEIHVVPEYCFAVDVTGHDLRLSPEHESFEWLEYERARQRLTWQSNQNALWELRERLRRTGRMAD